MVLLKNFKGRLYRNIQMNKIVKIKNDSSSVSYSKSLLKVILMDDRFFFFEY